MPGTNARSAPASAAAVASALAEPGYGVVRLTIGNDGTWHYGGARLPGRADAVRIANRHNGGR